jgi:hypothetical protein
MKQLLILLTTIFLYNFSNAQIFANTESGRRVILYSDGTWKYQEGVETNPCSKQFTGTVTVTNQRGVDIFIYYSKFPDQPNPAVIKIKANSVKVVNDIPITNVSYPYHWKASQEFISGRSLDRISGLEEGIFQMGTCDSKSIEILN